MGYRYGGGGFFCEAARRRGAGAEGRVFGAEGEGVRVWAFWLLEFGIFKDPAARRATTAAATPGTRNRPDAKTRNGPDAVAFGARFWPRLRAMGTPA